MSDLLSKLAISKAIMDKHNSIGRGNMGTGNYNTQTTNYDIETPIIEEFNSPSPKYNIPQELIEETRPRETKTTPPTKDEILNSKLPDEIKRLMIENPIVPTNPMMSSGPALSNELVEKATKLMGVKKDNINEQTKPKQISQNHNIIDNKEMRKMMKEVVQEVLKENGLIVESNDTTNESMVIKVGQHIFEGRISRIKKIKK